MAAALTFMRKALGSPNQMQQLVLGEGCLRKEDNVQVQDQVVPNPRGSANPPSPLLTDSSSPKKVVCGFQNS